MRTPLFIWVQIKEEISHIGDYGSSERFNSNKHSRNRVAFIATGSRVAVYA